MAELITGGTGFIGITSFAPLRTDEEVVLFDITLRDLIPGDARVVLLPLTKVNNPLCFCVRQKTRIRRLNRFTRRLNLVPH